MHNQAAATVGELVVDRPSRSRIFDQFGIDYCCGGKKPLAQACQERGLNLDAVLQRLNADETLQAPATEPDYAAMDMAALARHIEETHHAWLRVELPRIAALLTKLASAHGQRDPRLIELHALFDHFAGDLLAHMRKEEQVLFPALARLQAGELDSQQKAFIGSPIDAMTREHDEAGAALSSMRRLTDDFAVPAGACNTHRAALDALSNLEQDMHQHVHKENNILFPQARRAAGLS
jgi:regulator of cell morphogenesis and NO signaling